MPNPFLTVHGPRPERWWAVCNLCGQTSMARFVSAEEAIDWDHDCHTEADDDGKVTITVEYTVDDPPAISWVGSLTDARLREIKQALGDMHSWFRSSFWRSEHPHWRDMVAGEWATRRRRAVDAAMSAMEEIVECPYVCPGDGCDRRCRTRPGLKTHMRSCRRVDPLKFKHGEYDAAMVPGGLSEKADRDGAQ